MREQEQSTIRKREEYVTYDLFAVSCCGLRNCVLCLGHVSGTKATAQQLARSNFQKCSRALSAKSCPSLKPPPGWIHLWNSCQFDISQRHATHKPKKLPTHRCHFKTSWY